MPPVWSINSPSYLCEGIKLGSIPTATDEYKSHCIPGRLFDCQSGSNEATERCYRNGTIPSTIGMDNQYEQISTRPISTYRILRDRMGYLPQHKSPPGKENILFKKRSQQTSIKSKMELAVRKELARKTKFRVFCNTTRKNSLQEDTESSQHFARRVSSQKVSHSCKCTRGMQLVDSKSRKERFSFQTFGDHIHHFRCLGPRLGCTDKRKAYQWHLGHSPASVAHQQKRAVCCSSRCSVRERFNKKQESSRTVRQSNCNRLHKQSGRDEIIATNSSSLPAVNFGQQATGRNLSPIHTRDIQRRSRQSISTKQSFGLASFEEDMQTDISEMGQSRSGPLRIKQVKGSSCLCLPRYQGQRCSIHRCLQQEMGIQVSMDFPTSLVDSSGVSSSKPSQRLLHTDCSTLGQSVLEIGSTNTSDRPPISNPEPAPSPERFNNPIECSESSISTFGGLEGTGWSIITKNWSREDHSLIQKAWRTSSLKTYRAPWNTWVTRCEVLGLNPNKPDAASVAQHLSFLHSVKKLSPSTIKLHKSVIVTFADPNNRDSITNSPIVKQIIKAIELSKPPSSKKQIWDVKYLISWLENISIQEDSIFQISRHLVLLLLLASGRRIHDLTLLRIDENSMVIDESSVTFWPEFGSKTDSHSYRQSAWKLLQVPNRNLDPVLWTRIYLNVSKSRRNAGGNQIQSLFITSRGRVAPASKAVIAGWIKTAFSELNINFSPGSIRSAVASSRKDSNVPIDIILRNGNWRSDKNVIKHYFKEIINTPSKDDSNDLCLVNSSFTTL